MTIAKTDSAPATGAARLGETARVWLVALGFWLVFGLLCTILYPVTMTDSITRYAPMADAFAAGDWKFVFHPRFGVLFEVLCGGVSWLTGLSGAKSIQVVSSGFLALAGVPVFFLVKRLFGARIAWWSLALLLVNDDFTRYAMDGLRDTGKCLAFALVAYGAIEDRPAWLGLGVFVFVTLVAYGFALGSVFLFAWCVYCVLTRPLGLAALSSLVPFLGWAAGTAAVTVMTHAYTGHWVPTTHFIKLVGDWL